MKRIVYFVFAALISLSVLLPARAFAQEDPNRGVTLEDFPDPAFRAWVSKHVDKNKNGRLSRAEKEAVTKIRLSAAEVYDLTGIENFPNLKGLYIAGNHIKTLDLRGNPKLKTLDCTRNDLRKLDLTGCPNLVNLYCGFNPLPRLNLKYNTKLVELDCSEDKLKKLDLHRNPRLTFLNCCSNQLESLDVTGCTRITTLLATNNQLAALDVRDCPLLTYLDCNKNRIRKLDLSQNTELSALTADHNKFKKLDASKCRKLQWAWLDQKVAFTYYGRFKATDFWDGIRLYERKQRASGRIRTRTAVNIFSR